MSDTNNINLVPSQSTKRIWNKVSVTVNIPIVWGIFDKIARGVAIKKADTDVLFDYFLCIGIVVCSKLYPTELVKWNPSIDSFENDNQLEEIDEAIIRSFIYFTKQKTAQNIVIKKYPTCPVSRTELRRFYGLFFLKVSGSWKEYRKKEWNEALQRRLDQINASFTDDDAGLKSKSELALRTGIETDIVADDALYAARRVDQESAQADESKDNAYAEIDLDSEEAIKFFEEHQKKVRQTLIRETYLLENPGQEGIASFIG